MNQRHWKLLELSDQGQTGTDTATFTVDGDLEDRGGELTSTDTTLPYRKLSDLLKDTILHSFIQFLQGTVSWVHG